MTETDPDERSPDELRAYVFRYEEHMPNTDDLSLTVLKGHLLIEEMLVKAIERLLPNPGYLRSERLSFHQRVCLLRSAIRGKHDHDAWSLIEKLNTLRNALVHNLDPPELRKKIDDVFASDARTQPFDEVGINKTGEAVLDSNERLRLAIVTCIQFLYGVTCSIGRGAE